MFKIPTQGTALYVSFPGVAPPTLGLNNDRCIIYNICVDKRFVSSFSVTPVGATPYTKWFLHRFNRPHPQASVLII